MKLSITTLTFGISIAIAGILLPKPNALLALPINTAQYPESNTVSSPAMPEDAVQEQSAPTAIEPTSTEPSVDEDTVELPSSEEQPDSHPQIQDAPGYCRTYISPRARPGSFRYRQGLYRCLYGDG